MQLPARSTTLTLAKCRSILLLGIAFSLTTIALGADAYHCKQATCLSFGGPVKPAGQNQGWIVGEIRTFAFGDDSNAQVMTDLMAQGWVECAGQPLQRGGKFAPLFKAVGDGWGSGDGKTDFYLPDLRGVFVRGWNHLPSEAEVRNKPAAGTQALQRSLGGDLDASLRVAPRPDVNPPGTQGNSGDAVGSAQPDALFLHHHADAGHDHGLYAGGDMDSKVLGYNGYGNTYTLSNTPGHSGRTQKSSSNLGDPVDLTGNLASVSRTETRPKNLYVTYCIYVGLPVKLDANGRIVPK